MVINSRNVSEDQSYFIIEIKNTKLINDETEHDIPAESPAEVENKRKS